jgi:hypothetical protein
MAATYKIRTITAGVTLEPSASIGLWKDVLYPVCAFLVTAKAAMEATGVEVQTVRIVTNSFQVCHAIGSFARHV